MDCLEKKWRRKSSFQICMSSYQAYISFHLQAFLQMCNLPVKVVCRANAEYMSPSGKYVFSVDTVYSFVLRIESKALNLLGQYFTTGRISRISSPRCQILGFVFFPLWRLIFWLFLKVAVISLIMKAYVYLFHLWSEVFNWMFSTYVIPDFPSLIYIGLFLPENEF